MAIAFYLFAGLLGAAAGGFFIWAGGTDMQLGMGFMMIIMGLYALGKAFETSAAKEAADKAAAGGAPSANAPPAE